ncbi:hypothetical protein I7I48_11618 [Histoplasma ohiense]|nr:hypothetical protein I7I48_11618 [Histoplasma ohiense (nom. inval.)]
MSNKPARASSRYFFRSCSSRQRSKASSHLTDNPPQRSVTNPHVLDRIMRSTPRSFLSNIASDSVLASRGKNLAEYGSNRSSTTLSLSFADSPWRRRSSGSSGSGLVATPAQ